MPAALKDGMSCAIYSQYLVTSADRRKVVSLLEDETSTLWQLASADLLAEADKLFLSHNCSCRLCFKAVDTLAMLDVLKGKFT